MITRWAVSNVFYLALAAAVCCGCTRGDTRSLQEKLLELRKQETVQVTVQKPAVRYLDDSEPPTIAATEPYIRVFTVEETVADSLGRIGSDAVPSLIQAMQDKDADVRFQATRALAVMGPAAKDAVPALAKLLTDPDEDVRRGAARALGQIGPAAKEAVPSLIELLEKHRVTAPVIPAPVNPAPTVPAAPREG